MFYRSHRGGIFYTPENTMAAFKDAIAEGFEFIETDPRYTKDGVVVLLHDEVINRVCRNKDGSPIEKTTYIQDVTYSELMEYDAGIAKGEQFRGEKIARLDELLEFVQDKDVIIELDKKFPTDNMDPVLDIVEKYSSAKVAFFCGDTDRIKRILARLPEALIVYEGMCREEDLVEVTRLVKKENLYVWLYIDSPNTTWIEPERRTSAERCEMVKKYARLGIGLVSNPYDMRKALSYDPYVVEA